MAKRLSKLEIIKRCVNDHQAEKISIHLGAGKVKKIWLDVQTANGLLQLFNNAAQYNISKLELLPWDRLCNLLWSITK